MLSIMTVTPGTLVKDARRDADLSRRALAERAGVAYSTVARIEAGRVDPTTGMLARLVAAAGWELDLAMHPSSGPEIANLVAGWAPGREGEAKPNWTRLRALLDYLALHPDTKGSATLRPPAPSGSALVDNLLAAIAEKTCDDAGLPRPSWTRKVRPLGEW